MSYLGFPSTSSPCNRRIGRRGMGNKGRSSATVLLVPSCLGSRCSSCPSYLLGRYSSRSGSPPPPLPVCEQPLCPAEGDLWTPGYWAYAQEGYFWVPGTWVMG